MGWGWVAYKIEKKSYIQILYTTFLNNIIIMSEKYNYRTIIMLREMAVELNREKTENMVIGYIKEGPIYERNVTGFMAKRGKISNTDTFIMTNRENIMTLIQENERREEMYLLCNYQNMVEYWSNIFS